MENGTARDLVVAASRRSDRTQNKPRFAVLPSASVAMLGEVAGVGEVPTEVQRLLAEDATYRLRAILQDASQLMRHARRKRLRVLDLNAALSDMDVPPVPGHNGDGTPRWYQVADPVVKDAQLSYQEDPVVSLATVALGEVDEEITEMPPTVLHANWARLDGNPRATTQPNKPVRLLSDDMISYYDNLLTSATSDDTKLTQLALNEMRRGIHVAGLLPIVVNEVSRVMQSHHTNGNPTGESNATHDAQGTPLTSPALLRLITVLQTIIDNPNVFLSSYADMVCSCALNVLLAPTNTQPLPAQTAKKLYSGDRQGSVRSSLERRQESSSGRAEGRRGRVVERSVYSNAQEWIVRERTARLLANTCLSRWGSGGVEERYVTILSDVLDEPTRERTGNASLLDDVTRCGAAVLVLTELGSKAVCSAVLPRLTALRALIQQGLRQDAPLETQTATHHVRHAVCRACRLVLQSFAGEKKSQINVANDLGQGSLQCIKSEATLGVKSEPKADGESCTTSRCPTIADNYRAMYDCVGDVLEAFIDPRIFAGMSEIGDTSKEITIKLGDSSCRLSGTEMLREFLPAHEDTEGTVKIKQEFKAPVFAPPPPPGSQTQVPQSRVRHSSKRSRSEDSTSGHARKRHRRSASTRTLRLSDAFDVTYSRGRSLSLDTSPSSIQFNIPRFGTSIRELKQSVSGASRVKQRPTVTGIRTGKIANVQGKIAPTSSLYRSLCVRLKPIGKKQRINRSSRKLATQTTQFPTLFIP